MKKYFALIGLLLVVAVLLSGCATGLAASSWPGAIVDAKNAYVAGGSYVYAVDLQSGTQVWRFPDKASTANPFFATPALTSDGQLIVGGFDKKLYSLNIQTGSSNWEFDQAHDRWIGGALVLDNTIYAPNADYNLYALDLQGNLKWTFQADQAIWGTPVSDGKNIYFGTLGRRVYAVNAQSGQQVWVQSVDGAVLGLPALGSDGTLYVGSYGGTVYALDSATGGTLWTATASSWIWTGPVLQDGELYFGDEKGMLYAHPLTDTGISWNQQLNGAILGSPLVTGNMIVVGTEAGNVYFMDLTGQNLRPTSVSGQVYSTPIAAGDLVLVTPTGQDAVMVALDQTGAIKWSFIPPK
jgi:outer membrane protein assembly factor BamB